MLYCRKGSEIFTLDVQANILFQDIIPKTVLRPFPSLSCVEAGLSHR
jgi:hypothetical protein